MVACDCFHEQCVWHMPCLSLQHLPFRKRLVAHTSLVHPRIIVFLPAWRLPQLEVVSRGSRGCVLVSAPVCLCPLRHGTAC